MPSDPRRSDPEDAGAVWHRGLVGGTLARGPAFEETSDTAWLAAMVEAEVALARASAAVGITSPQQAAAIERAAARGPLDVDEIGRGAASTGTPVVRIIELLRARVSPGTGKDIHRGATSQDIVDTATMLVAHRALGGIIADIGRAADAAARHASTHRATVMAARTLLQQAAPTTFGLKAAGWMIGLDEAAIGLREQRDRRLAVQLGGAAGTMDAFGPAGPGLIAEFARELGLAEPVLPWHTNRNRVTELASALGVAAGAVGKPAGDVVLLAQTEVGEVREGVVGRGGSSSMAHKHNPIAAVSAVACARQAPGLVATLLASMAHEHERAAGAWHAEWAPLRSLLVAVGSAAAWLADCLDHLEVDAAAMSANLARGGLDHAMAADGRVATAETLVDRALEAHAALGTLAASTPEPGR